MPYLFLARELLPSIPHRHPQPNGVSLHNLVVWSAIVDCLTFLVHPSGVLFILSPFNFNCLALISALIDKGFLFNRFQFLSYIKEGFLFAHVLPSCDLGDWCCCLLWRLPYEMWSLSTIFSLWYQWPLFCLPFFFLVVSGSHMFLLFRGNIYLPCLHWQSFFF